jgi:hypothetical protein
MACTPLKKSVVGGAVAVRCSQHRTPPVVVSAQVREPFAAMACTPLRKSAAGGVTGPIKMGEAADIVIPPQQRTPPAAVRAQV